MYAVQRTGKNQIDLNLITRSVHFEKKYVYRKLTYRNGYNEVEAMGIFTILNDHFHQV